MTMPGGDGGVQGEAGFDHLDLLGARVVFFNNVIFFPVISIPLFNLFLSNKIHMLGALCTRERCTEGTKNAIFG